MSDDQNFNSGNQSRRNFIKTGAGHGGIDYIEDYRLIKSLLIYYF